MKEEAVRKTGITIVGFGNIGRAVLAAIGNFPEMEARLILSRDPERVRKLVKDVPVEKAGDEKALVRADIAILCGGSKDDLPVQGPWFAQRVCTVDSYDNHSNMGGYFKAMDLAAKKGGKHGIIAAGWDPGLFSMARVLGRAIIPGGSVHTFYGLGPRGGLSMGHSDAIRKIPGVIDARQYTHANSDTIEHIRNSNDAAPEKGEMHWRECIVLAEEGADKKRIEDEIKSMPGYFAPYRTTVEFVDNRSDLSDASPHDGMVLAGGELLPGIGGRLEFHASWESNPLGTAHILLAHARALTRLREERPAGAYSILDIPPAWFLPLPDEILVQEFL